MHSNPNTRKLTHCLKQCKRTVMRQVAGSHNKMYKSTLLSSTHHYAIVCFWFSLNKRKTCPETFVVGRVGNRFRSLTRELTYFFILIKWRPTRVLLRLLSLQFHFDIALKLWFCTCSLVHLLFPFKVLFRLVKEQGKASLCCFSCMMSELQNFSWQRNMSWILIG